MVRTSVKNHGFGDARANVSQRCQQRSQTRANNRTRFISVLRSLNTPLVSPLPQGNGLFATRRAEDRAADLRRARDAASVNDGVLAEIASYGVPVISVVSLNSFNFKNMSIPALTASSASPSWHSMPTNLFETVANRR